MSLPHEIVIATRTARALSMRKFADELSQYMSSGVSGALVNMWEKRQSVPNFDTMYYTYMHTPAGWVHDFASQMMQALKPAKWPENGKGEA